MHVVVAKVNEVLFEGQARSLTVPGASGEMTVLGHHMPLVTTLLEGTITVRTDAAEKQFSIQNGVLEVRRDGATVIL